MGHGTLGIYAPVGLSSPTMDTQTSCWPARPFGFGSVAYDQPLGAPYGVAPIVVAAIVSAAAAAVQLGAQVATSHSAKQEALRREVPCIARIDARIVKLRQKKGPGHMKEIRELLAKRKAFAKNPASCKDVRNAGRAAAAGAAADAEVDAALSTPESTAQAAVAASEAGPDWRWAVAAAGALAILGGIAVAVSKR